MSERENHEETGNAVRDDLVALLRQHQGLRTDVEHLLVEKQRLLQELEQDQHGKKDGAGPAEKSDQNSNDDGKGQQQDGKGKDEGDKKEDKKEGDSEEQKKQPKPPLKERAKAWIPAHPLGAVLIIVGVVLLAVALFFLWMYLQSYVSTDDAQIDGHTHQISSRVPGTVTQVYVEDNRNVIQGQVVVELDSHDYQTALAQAQANLSQALSGLAAQSPNVPITRTTEATNEAAARLEIANAESALQAARQTYQAALSDLEQARATAENAAREEQRYRHLADKQEVSRELYEQRATTARTQAALVASRQAGADAAEKGVKQREAMLAQVSDRHREVESNQPRQVAVQQAGVAGKQASVQAAQAQLDQARLNLAYCKILAPVTGIVGSKTVEVGQQVAPGQELFALTRVDDIWVTANFKETQTIRVHPGQGVTIHVDALDLDFEGGVENLPGATGAKYSLLPPENATGNYVKVVQRLPVRIRFKPGQRGMDRLRPGMSVEPKVWLK